MLLRRSEKIYWVELPMPAVASAHPGRGSRARLLHAHLGPHARTQRVDEGEPLRRFHVPEGPAVAGFEALCKRADAVDRTDRFAKRKGAIGAHQSVMPLLGVDESDAGRHQASFEQGRK